MGWFYNMSKIAWCFIGLCISTLSWANSDCFIAKEKNVIIKQEGACTKHQAPCSTFKIAISLMGYDAGILINETHPEWPFKKGYSDYLSIWKQPHNPQLWLQNSCVWYSQLITQKLGMTRFKHYVHAFNYGNQDVSGDKGAHNALTRSWLSSSLRISPAEQIEFLSRLTNNQLPVSQHALDATKNILFVDNLQDGWMLFGKTGAGYFLKDDGSRQADKQIGWFVGWMQKDSRKVFFVQYVEEMNNKDFSTGKHARDMVKQKLTGLIQKGLH